VEEKKKKKKRGKKVTTRQVPFCFCFYLALLTPEEVISCSFASF
jgi:hypothetical protein